MEWKKFGMGFLLERSVEVRTLRVADSTDTVKRFRACTVWQDREKFTRVPALAQLYKSEKGHIGVYVTGKNMGFVKVGKTLTVQQGIFAPVSSVSKKAIKQLTYGIDIEIIDVDGMTMGMEK